MSCLAGLMGTAPRRTGLMLSFPETRPRLARPSLFPSLMLRARVMDRFLAGRAETPRPRLFKLCLESQEESWRPFLGAPHPPHPPHPTPGQSQVTAAQVPADICHLTTIIPNVFNCWRPRTQLKKKKSLTFVRESSLPVGLHP